MAGIDLTSAVKETGRIERLKPVEKDFINKPGYERKYRKNGKYDWRYRFQANKGTGTLTREAREVQEMMAPYVKASDEYQRGKQAAIPKVEVRAPNGVVQQVEERKLGQLERQGWKKPRRVRTYHDQRGSSGMLWKWVDGWEPTGRWCYTKPFFPEKKPPDGRPDGSMKGTGIHYSPDGEPWRRVAGAWERA